MQEILNEEKKENINEEKQEFVSKKGFKFKCYLFFKRIFDIFSSGMVLILFSPLYLLIALLVKCGDGGIVFYML